jgi:hypothetical protein
LSSFVKLVNPKCTYNFTLYRLGWYGSWVHGWQPVPTAWWSYVAWNAVAGLAQARLEAENRVRSGGDLYSLADGGAAILVLHPMFLQPTARASTRGQDFGAIARAMAPATRVVETILGHKHVGTGSRRVTHYLIKWKDLPFLQSSWVPQSRLGTCQAARNRYAQSGGRDLTKSTPYVSVATSAATAAVSWAQARHGFDVASAHDEAIWRNILAIAPHFTHQNGTGFRAKHATDFVRAQKADSENVSGSDADAGSSRSQSADIRLVSVGRGVN